MTNSAETAVRRFVADMMNQVTRDNALPLPVRPLVLTMQRSGGLAETMASTANGEHASWDASYGAAVSLAAAALRVALCGDASVIVPEQTDAGGLVRADRHTAAQLLQDLGLNDHTRAASTFTQPLHDGDPLPPGVFADCMKVARRAAPNIVLDEMDTSIAQHLLARVIYRLYMAGWMFSDIEAGLNGKPAPWPEGKPLVTTPPTTDDQKRAEHFATNLLPQLWPAVNTPLSGPEYRSALEVLTGAIRNMFTAGVTAGEVVSFLTGVPRPAPTVPDAAPALGSVKEERKSDGTYDVSTWDGERWTVIMGGVSLEMAKGAMKKLTAEMPRAAEKIAGELRTMITRYRDALTAIEAIASDSDGQGHRLAADQDEIDRLSKVLADIEDRAGKALAEPLPS